MPWISLEAGPVISTHDSRSHSKSQEGLLSIWKFLCLSGQVESHLILLNSGDVYFPFSFMESKIG